jgi:sugar phosphate isomerase/epimerase
LTVEEDTMRLSGSNYGMPTLPLEEALAFHHEVGYRSIEITVLSGYTTALEGFDAAERRHARDLLRRFELTCSGIANFQSLTDDDPAVAEPILQRHRDAVDLAVDLTIGDVTPVVPFTSGGGVADWPAIKERLVERVGVLADYARSRGVVLTMKAHANGGVSRPYQLVYLQEQVGSPSFRFCFDMSHYEVQGLSIEQAMYPLLPLSAHVEVKASIGRAPNQEYMIPGEENTQSDFDGQFAAMAALGYRGYVVPEMSVHVMRRPNYDQFSSMRLAFERLTRAIRDAGAMPE